MTEILPVCICGARGRMGRTLIDLAPDENARVAAALDLGDDLAAGLADCAVVIDFSHRSATPVLAEACAERGLPLIIGTTGHDSAERERVLAATGLIPVVWAGNYSVGVNLLLHMVQTAASVLGNRYDPEITEIHHRHKKDAPSGTALNLAEALAVAPDFQSASQLIGRSGETGERPTDQIGLHALRGGEVVGEHTVFFFGPHDRIELTHRAADRRIFASGAYRAAHWAVNRPPALYSMRDVLQLDQAGEPS